MSETAIKYLIPDQWMKYDKLAMVDVLTDAKAAVRSLTTLPYQRSWTIALQEIQLKREVAGTSRIEGADFTERELDMVMAQDARANQTRSQRQASTALSTYQWISKLAKDRPINAELIREIHARIVRGSDDDHCQPGVLRGPDENVTFGIPKHRGASGGHEVSVAFNTLCENMNGVFRQHDLLIQALAVHYYFAAMHPFLDGNGRTARALEALMLQRAGLRDTLFISMSNYYYEEKDAYLAALAEVRSLQNDLTPFIVFGLRGIYSQCTRLFDELKTHIQINLFRDQMHQLYNRLMSPRKRVMAERQLRILTVLLDAPQQTLSFSSLASKTNSEYIKLKAPTRTIIRDLNYLLELKAIEVKRKNAEVWIAARLEWPTELTETELFKEISRMPQVKNTPFADIDDSDEDA